MRKHAVKWLIVLFSCLTFLPFLSPFGQVAIIDIGQGDTFLIILPFHRGAYLIDAAARGQFKTEPWQERQSASVFDRMIAPALRAQRVRKIDGIFITHADMDHIGSLVEVTAQIPTEHLYLPIGMAKSDKGMTFVARALETAKYATPTVQWLQTGDHVSLKGHTDLRVLAPDQIGEGENENLLVMYSKIGALHWLFTGDIVGDNEEKVFNYLRDNQLPIDSLKVSHHGSDYSTKNEWIDQFHPKYAWFSVEENNRYDQL